MSDAPESNKPTELATDASKVTLEDNEVRSETLIVPPPGFRERLEAAQRARANEIRASVVLPSHLTQFREPQLDEETVETTTSDKVENKTSPTL